MKMRYPNISNSKENGPWETSKIMKMRSQRVPKSKKNGAWETSGETLGTKGDQGGSQDLLFDHLGLTLDALGTTLGVPGAPLDFIWELFGASRHHFKRIWGTFGHHFRDPVESWKRCFSLSKLSILEVLRYSISFENWRNLPKPP